MNHPKPKPFVEKELRLSGEFSFKMLINISNLYTPLKKKGLLHSILMITSITYLRMVLRFVNEAKKNQPCSN